MHPDFTGLILEGKYRLTGALGSGGMGYVWRAEHVRLGRPFAVKLLRPELVSDPAVLARFQQEAQAAARIGSRHIVDVVDVGQTPGGAPFLVMEFLKGRALSAELAARGPLPLARAIELACQILDGLSAAHRAGIVHRDLKPDNVFLLDEGGGRDYVKLLDFGVAKARDDPRAQHLTRTGMLLGTPRYMSPEQVLGRRDVDHRADLWAVGVILYECLTGRVPFEAPDLASTLAAILQQAPAAPAVHRPELEPWLGTAVLRALAKAPAERFADAAAFRAALQKQEPSWDAPSPLGGRLPSWSTSSGPTPSWEPALRAPSLASAGGTVAVGPTVAAPSVGGPALPGAAGPSVTTTAAPHTVLVTAPSLAAQRPAVWPWLLAGLLVLGVAIAAVWFLATRVTHGSDATEPGSRDAGATAGGAPAAAAGGKEPTGVDAEPSGGWESLPLAEQRARWVDLQVAQSCEGTRLALQLGRTPTREEALERWNEICARHGFGRIGCARFITRFLEDPEPRQAMYDGIGRCVREAQGLDEAGRPLPRDAAAPDTAGPVVAPMTVGDAVTLAVTAACRSTLAEQQGRGVGGAAGLQAESRRLLQERGTSELEWARAMAEAHRVDPKLDEKLLQWAMDCVAAATPETTATPE